MPSFKAKQRRMDLLLWKRMSQLPRSLTQPGARRLPANPFRCRRAEAPAESATISCVKCRRERPARARVKNCCPTEWRLKPRLHAPRQESGARAYIVEAIRAPDACG